MTLRTCPEAMSPASPVRPLPALLDTMVNSRAPCSTSASMSSSGAPTAPKPVQSTTAPSLMSETAAARLTITLFIIDLEGYPVTALELQNITRLARTGDFKRQVLEDGSDAADLIGIRLGKLPLADIDRVLEPDANIAAHHRGHRHEGQLMPPGRQHRPSILLAEQLVGDALHMRKVLGIGPDAAENAEDRLHEERRLDQLAVEKMSKRIEVADIVALEFELRAATLAELLKNMLDIFESIPENEIPRVFQVLRLPVEFPFLVTLKHGVEAKIHRAHIERADLRAG